MGAALANLVNEAALTAARHNLEQVTQVCFEEAMDRIMLGAERPLVLSKEERRVIAYHEDGHALVAMLTPGADPVHKVTIVPRGQTPGVTQIVPIDDRTTTRAATCWPACSVGLGGRVAEELVTGEITTGAENDLKDVTQLARQMVTRWWMSQRLGTVFLGREVGLRKRESYSEQTAALIGEKVQQLISERYTYVQHLLSQHQEELERIAQALLERESLDEQQLQRLAEDAHNNAEHECEDKASCDRLATPASR